MSRGTHKRAVNVHTKRVRRIGKVDKKGKERELVREKYLGLCQVRVRVLNCLCAKIQS